MELSHHSGAYSIGGTQWFLDIYFSKIYKKACKNYGFGNMSMAVRELLGSLWELFGRAWACLGGLGALLGGRLGSLGLFSKPRGRNLSPGESTITQDAGYRKTCKKQCFFMVFVSYDRFMTAHNVYLSHQESSLRASEWLLGAVYASQMLLQDIFGFLEVS